MLPWVYWPDIPPQQQIRTEMKKMGDAAGVPIEPDEQTRLLDACIGQPGVICGGVPGGELLIT